MDCLVMPVSILKRRCSSNGRYTGGYNSTRLRYHPLVSEQDELLLNPEKPSVESDYDHGDLISVVVGKEKREFLVDPIVLQATPFRVLIHSSKQHGDKGGAATLAMADDQVDHGSRRRKRVIFVDVDVILFEHMLWLLKNDCSSFFNLNLQEIIDFYSQDN